MLENQSKIQLAVNANAAEIALLSRASIEKGLGWKWTAEAVKRAIKNKSTNVVVAKEGKILAGFGIMKYGYQKANLDLLAVKSDFRRSGTGTCIVRWLEEVARVAGIFHIYVQLRQKNSAAKKFYLSLGYSVIDIVPGYYNGIENALVMYRYLGLTEKVDSVFPISGE